MSYGVLGDERGADYYAGQNGYDIGSLNKKMSLEIRQYVDPNITWESSNQFQVGLEFDLFDGRLEGNLDYYRKITSNLFFTKRLAPSTGDAILTVNDGELLNAGLEFDFTGHIVKTDDWKVSASLNGEFLQNELLEMPMDDATGERKLLNVTGSTAQAKGRSLYDYYMPIWAGVNPANGDPLWYQRWVDKNNDGMYQDGEGIKSLTDYMAANPNATILQRVTNTYADATTEFIEKTAIPVVRGAMRFNVAYKGFSLSSQFAYSVGGYAYDYAYAESLMGNGELGGGNLSVDMRNSWKKPGDITNVPRLYTNYNTRVNASSTRFLTKSDYFALNNVRLGYTVPEDFVKSIGFSGIDVWVSGDNLFLLSERKGFNPTSSISGASDSYRYLPVSSITFGARLKF